MSYINTNKPLLSRLRSGGWHLSHTAKKPVKYTEFVKGRFFLRVYHPSGNVDIFKA